MHKCPPALSFNQSRLPQYAQMLGYGRLGDCQFVGQGPHTQEGFTVAVAIAENNGLVQKQFDQSQAGGVGQGFKQLGEYSGIIVHISNC
jgi:hypothetical protein